MRPFLVLTVGAVLLAQTPQAPPQQQKIPDDLPTIKVDVDVVSVLTSVRDKKNTLVPNLEQKDFTILEDGKPQPIKYFTRETDLPLTIGLLIDVSASQGNLIQIERDAAAQFFTQVLRKKDEAKARKHMMEEMGAAYSAHGLITLAGSRIYTSLADTDEVIDDALNRFEDVFKLV